MKWVTFHDGTSERTGVVEQEGIYAHGPDASLLDLLRGGVDLVGEGADLKRHADSLLPLESVELRAPIPVPPSVRDFLAFEEHAANALRAQGLELDPDWYELPVFYFSNPAAVTGPRDPVPMAPGSTRWDYELEVAAVVGREGSDLAPDVAESHIAGFCIMCDFSARDLQAREMRLGLGPAKGKDTATSFGPWLVTPDELAPYRDGARLRLTMTAEVNGLEYSAGTLADAHWTFGQMLAYASRGTTLMPGDVVGSGTVGTGCILELSGLYGEERFPWLAEGDVVRLHVEALGELVHEVVASHREPIGLR